MYVLRLPLVLTFPLFDAIALHPLTLHPRNGVWHVTSSSPNSIFPTDQATAA